MRPGLLMSDNTLSLNRAWTISPRPSVIYARHYGRCAGERTTPNAAAPSRAHVNGSLMKQYDRCIIGDSPLGSPSLSLSPSPSVSLALRVSPRRCNYLRDSRSPASPPSPSTRLCRLMANSSSPTAHNFRGMITKEDARAVKMTRRNGAPSMRPIRREPSALINVSRKRSVYKTETID